ncbi:hypothetical protein [Paenibacillus contaminans]|uniref:ABC transporter substrate-binding protein n=1 Tax=Paenibacillus contaminans TaxID=450362 RepID=A0A329LQ03_9BACL|nr:hypothetical protein [Paenibacillus contaminans]RAV09934.1 hypothetical protein DQG23_38800 [Paenibacillus contaminans]
MRNRKFKWGSLAIVLMMLAAIIAGCTEEKQKAPEATKEPAGGQETTDGAFVPKKNLELTIWNTQGTDVQAVEKPKEDIPGDWLANKTKVKVKEFYGNGGQQWEPKLTTLVASGNLPNLVMTQAGQGPAHHAKLHEGDLNWELTPELLQKYAPDVWKNVPAYIWDSIKIDGKIYGIPFTFPVDKQIDPNVSDELLSGYGMPKNQITGSTVLNGLFIRDDILKKLIPTAMNYEEAMKLIKEKNAPLGDDFVLPIKSTEEYIKFMYDIKALDLKEGNKPVYASGYDGGDNWIALSVLGADMMGYKGYYYTGWLNIPEKKMDFGYLNPAFKEAAKIQNKMITDKVIDPESLVHNAEKFKEKVMNGQYAIVPVSWVGLVDKVNEDLAKNGKTFRFVPFYTQVPQRPEFPSYVEGPPSFLDTLTILKTVKEDEVPQVLNWINTMFTEEWEEIKFWGTKEAGLYETLSNGQRKFKDEKLQKYLVEGDSAAMDWRDAKGLAFNNMPYNGGTPGFWYGVSKWANSASKYNPQVMNKLFKYDTLSKAIAFPLQSKWLKGFAPVPNVQSWSAEYANIPEVQKLWSTRASWDDPFKVTLTSKNEEDFNKKWDNAVANFKKVVDVNKMLEEQTKVMLPLLEKRSSQAK